MSSQYHPDTKYVDCGKRTPKENSLGNLLLDHFDRHSGKTFQQVANEMIESNWKPPKSVQYSTPEEKKKFLHGYFTDLVREKYLRPIEN